MCKKCLLCLDDDAVLFWLNMQSSVRFLTFFINTMESFVFCVDIIDLNLFFQGFLSLLAGFMASVINTYHIQHEIEYTKHLQ